MISPEGDYSLKHIWCWTKILGRNKIFIKMRYRFNILKAALALSDFSDHPSQLSVLNTLNRTFVGRWFKYLIQPSEFHPEDDVNWLTIINDLKQSEENGLNE